MAHETSFMCLTSLLVPMTRLKRRTRSDCTDVRCWSCFDVCVYKRKKKRDSLGNHISNELCEEAITLYVEILLSCLFVEILEIEIKTQFYRFKMTALWDVLPYTVVEICRRFRVAFCLHHQSDV
jgi:hypothetical protein